MPPFADPLPVDQETRLLALAADLTFDPDGYKRLACGVGFQCRCRVCRTLHAPLGCCGYCRGRVKVIRAAATPGVQS